MSIASRARHVKQPSPESSTRPRKYGVIVPPPRFDLTAWVKEVHAANKKQRPMDAGKRGTGFGGSTVFERARRKRLKSEA